MIEESAEVIANAQDRGQKLSEWVLLSNLEFFEHLPDVMKERLKKIEDELYPGAGLSDQMRALMVACYAHQNGGEWPSDLFRSLKDPEATRGWAV
jgi:hypothetical protein